MQRKSVDRGAVHWLASVRILICVGVAPGTERRLHGARLALGEAGHVAVAVIIVRLVSVALRIAQYPLGDAMEQPFDVGWIDQGQVGKGQWLLDAGVEEHAVHREYVKMDIEIDRRTEVLHEGDRARSHIVQT